MSSSPKAIALIPALVFFLTAGALLAQEVRLLSDLGTGGVAGASIDDAGMTVYAPSSADPTAANPRHAWQVFSWDPSTGVASQVSSFLDGVHFSNVSVTGGGDWLAFVSRGNPTGQNHDESLELFVMGPTGAGLAQLTSDPGVAAGSVRGGLISGTGSRVVFVADTDPLGTNPSRVDQLFAVNRDGTGLTQLTQVFDAHAILDFSLSDDGQRVVFESASDLLGSNADGSSEIFAVNGDGTSLRQLTSGTGVGSRHPEISGNGSRVAFDSWSDLLGTNPDQVPQIFVVDWAGTNLAQLTAVGAFYGAQYPSITSDGQTVFYASDEPDGTANPDENSEIWKIQADGTAKTLLTETPDGWTSTLPEVSGDGSRVVFYTTGEFPNGSNGDHDRELVAMTGTGLEVIQLSTSTSGMNRAPDITPDGTRIVFSAERDLSGSAVPREQIFRVQADGTGLFQVTNLADGNAGHPGVTSDGSTIVFVSAADPLGSNADHGEEIFAVNADGANLRRQLTTTTSGSNGDPRISGDGAWVYFASSAPFFESIPGTPSELYRVAVATGTVERAGGLRKAPAGIAGGTFPDRSGTFAPDFDGDRVAFPADGEWGRENDDWSREIWLADQSAPSLISVGKESPTVVSWTVEPKPRRYDVIRGDVANLAPGAGGTVDLGAVVCVENDSPDADTVGSDDPATPLPGQVFFFLHRGSQGLIDGPGSYGRGAGGGERMPAAGGCSG